MLRVLKQKAQGSKSEIDQGLNPSREQSAHIVSHVPISTGSRTISSSAESTISSVSGDFEGPVTTTDAAMIDLVPTVGFATNQIQDRDSPVGSTAIATPMRPPLSSHKPFARSRTVSLDEVYSKSPMAKKPRLTLHYPTDTSCGTAGIFNEPTTSNGTNLLAREEDDYALNPLHAFIRKQVEVFTVTSFDLNQPAPGRKLPIKLHQVGLRCIHCKGNTTGKRIKRAICYPSNVKRIYHSVSDMKFDHFSNCSNLPPAVRAQFESLKVERAAKRNSSSRPAKRGRQPLSSLSTAQYYHDSAVSMGLVDGPEGIFMEPSVSSRSVYQGECLQATLIAATPSPNSQLFPSYAVTAKTENAFSFTTTEVALPVIEDALTSMNALQPLNAFHSKAGVTLDERSDGENLNQIHCFVRRHVEIFAANKNDVAAPSPGRKTRVVLGQVGIRCMHCTKLPVKLRVKRAICYPPTVAGIYHAVSNMKFDHFASCRGLPTEARQEFCALQDACCRKVSGGGNKATKGSASSTSKYYQASAVRKGLVDTETGIRFADPQQEKKEAITSSQCILLPTGLSALVQAACQAA